MTGSEVAIAIVAGAMSGAGAATITLVYNSAQERRDRHREHFSQALQAVSAYEEFPYVVRRRKSSDPEGERIRISSEMREVQASLSYHCAWILTESVHVGRVYGALVRELRAVAGALIHRAWLMPAIESDSEMNIADIGPELAKLQPLEEEYLGEVSDHLSVWPRWLLRARRSERKHA